MTLFFKLYSLNYKMEESMLDGLLTINLSYSFDALRSTLAMIISRLNSQ